MHIGQQLRPRATARQAQRLLPVALRIRQFGGVLAHHKFPPHRRRVGVQYKPEGEHPQGNQRAQRRSQCGLPHHGPVPVKRAQQQRAPECRTGRHDQRERLVGQPQPERQTKGEVGAPAQFTVRPGNNPGDSGGRIALRGGARLCQPPPQQAKKRQIQPEGFWGTGQKRAAITKGAKKTQVHASCQQGRLPAAGDGFDRPGDRGRDQQGVDDAGHAQRPKLPALPPVARHHGLPEQQRRFGVAHVAQLGRQRQPLAGRCRHPRNVRVHHLVAVAGNVRVVQPQRVNAHGKQQQGEPGQGGISADGARNRGRGHACTLTAGIHGSSASGGGRICLPARLKLLQYFREELSNRTRPVFLIVEGNLRLAPCIALL